MSTVSPTQTIAQQYEDVSEVSQESQAFLTAMFRISKVNNAITDVQESFGQGVMTDLEAIDRISALLDHFSDIKKSLQIAVM